MVLRKRLELVAETLQETELAAEQRLREGEALWRAGRFGAAVYLFGYAAEMLLKNAYFRYRGSPTTLPIDFAMLGTAKAQAQALGVSAGPESYHSLRFWAALIRAERARTNRPLPNVVDQPFVQRSRRLYQNWWVAMRYRTDHASARDVQTAFDDVSWLRANYRSLWSR